MVYTKEIIAFTELSESVQIQRDEEQRSSTIVFDSILFSDIDNISVLVRDDEGSKQSVQQFRGPAKDLDSDPTTIVSSEGMITMNTAGITEKSTGGGCNGSGSNRRTEKQQITIVIRF